MACFLRAKRDRQLARYFHQPPEPLVVRDDGGTVIAQHPQAREIGEGVLRSGGNAFDAFVATVAAENVLAEGASTLAGPLGVMVYTSRDGRTSYMDAEFNDPLDPSWHWAHRMPRDGRTVLVPGAPAGLAALAEGYGTRPLAELLQPAMDLATGGFPICNLMAAFIAQRAPVLRRTTYGRTTYFSPNGKPLQAGETIRLPAVASFLAGLSREGPAYVYGGEWGRNFLAEVRERHGLLTAGDLASYRVQWTAPWRTTYRNHELYSSPGYGGLWTQLALKTLEHIPLPDRVDFVKDAMALETLVRVVREVWAESWLLDWRALENRALVESRVTEAYTRSIAERVRKNVRAHPVSSAGSHSYHIIVLDQAGNCASGTTTIEAEPWGEGFFVQGIPLSTAGVIPWSTAAGRRRLSPFSIHFAFHEQRLRFGVGALSNSAAEAAFQFLVNLIDFKLPPDGAVTAPRCGTFPAKSATRVDLSRNWIDPRVDPQVLAALRKHGLKLQPTGIIDTGLGSILAVQPSGGSLGITAPVPYISNPFGGRVGAKISRSGPI